MQNMYAKRYNFRPYNVNSYYGSLEEMIKKKSEVVIF